MGDFICKLGTDRGEIIEKRFSADSQKSLRLDLEQRGFYIFNIRPAGFSIFSRGEKKIKQDDFIIFNQEFKSLLHAGLPVTQSLDLLIGRQGDTELGRMLKEIRDSIETGSAISEAFAVHKDRLPIAYVSTLIAGERSGDLADAVGRYVKYARLTNKLRKNFRKALYYPAFLIILSGVMISLMLLYVLPEFSKFYEGFEEELPGFTLFVLGVADVLRGNWLFILAGIIAAIFTLRWWRQTDGGAKSLARLQFRLPIIGDIAHKYQLSQIFHSLSVMLRGGMPLLSCLDDMRSSVANPLLTEALATAHQRVSEGESLTAAIENTPLDTDLSGEMVQVGESTGSLPEMLTNIAEFYDEEVENRTEALLSLVEPVLLLIMAIIIASLLFAMYYPLFRLMGSLGT